MINSQELYNEPSYTIDNREDDNHKHDGNCVVLIYADWCHHCQSMYPEWINASDEMNKNTKVINIESNELPRYQEMLNTHRVRPSGYPTVYAYMNNDTDPVYYHGDRNRESFIHWVKELFPTPKKEPSKSKTSKSKTSKSKTSKSKTSKSKTSKSKTSKNKTSKSKTSKSKTSKKGGYLLENEEKSVEKKTIHRKKKSVEKKPSIGRKNLWEKKTIHRKKRVHF